MNRHTGWGNRGLSWASTPVFGRIDWKRHCVLQIEIWAGYLLNWNKTYYTLGFVHEFCIFLPTDSHATNKIYTFILSRKLINPSFRIQNASPNKTNTLWGYAAFESLSLCWLLIPKFVFKFFTQKHNEIFPPQPSPLISYKNHIVCPLKLLKKRELERRR